MLIENQEVVTSGVFPRIARLDSEFYEWVEDPESFVAALRKAPVGAELFTFLQKITDRTPHFAYPVELESIAALPITDYDSWWKSQINDKTRNMIRRAQKSGVEVRPVPFDDDLVRRIKLIYDECPLRQGKPFSHYGQQFETLKASHGTFLHRCQFLGAFYGDRLIGFAKLVDDGRVADLMHIISMLEHRDKAPTNALLAKAVEHCAEQSFSYLVYGPWRGTTLIDFKKHHAFRPFELPRYFVPLNTIGTLALRLGLHRNLSNLLPQQVRDRLVELRRKLNALRYDVPKKA